jgi:hypothetical protein
MQNLQGSKIDFYVKYDLDSGIFKIDTTAGEITYPYSGIALAVLGKLGYTGKVDSGLVYFRIATDEQLQGLLFVPSTNHVRMLDSKEANFLTTQMMEASIV